MNKNHSEKTDGKVVSRFAPSPTGNLHFGGLRTALFSYLYAKHNKGKFILRIEDTDKERSKKEFEQNILDSLSWLGIQYDEFYRQSERSEIYKRHLEALVAKDLAYVSEEAVVEEGKRSSVIRFRNPNTTIIFSDMIRGEISFATEDLGDFVIAKSFDEPLYHFAVVVDDHEMGVTHVVRGEEHISNTPRQILIGEAIGAKRPVYGHLPLILAADKSKLSKRKGAQAVTEYKEKGFLPEALINYAALLGWNPGTDEEIFTPEEIIEKFDISKVQKSGAVYNEEKLRWVNREHLRRMSSDKLEKAIIEVFQKSEHVKSNKWLGSVTPTLIKKLAPAIIERIETFGDLETSIIEGEYDYCFEAPKYDAKDLVWKDSGEDAVSKTKNHLAKAAELFGELSEEDMSDPEKIKPSIWAYATDHGRGDVLWPIRFALTGRTKSADPFTVAYLIGQKECVARLETAIKNLEKL
ncbi:MAG: glutamate--tRNA ligase [Patescibacteria group bacterium]